MKIKNPKYSIVLCTYNGSRKITKSLTSLFNQEFPKNNYEIIVVNDGSTDDTLDKIAVFPVVIVNHDKKRGLAAARNTGLRRSRGEIIICFDDDCTADRNWLAELNTAYNDKKVMGAGGMIMLPKNPTLTDEYCFNCGYGSPVPLTLGHSKSIFIRFWDYLVTNFSNPQSKYINGSKVLELPGILSSFRKNKLIAIKGWNDALVNISEDNDICRRLRKNYPNEYFVVMPTSKVVHEQKLSFFKFLSKEFKRGKSRKKYYILKNETAPYFPYPFIFLLFLMISVIIGIPLFTAIIIPYILYPWWVIRAIKDRNMKMLLFPYMQLLHEGATVLGMLFIK